MPHFFVFVPVNKPPINNTVTIGQNPHKTTTISTMVGSDKYSSVECGVEKESILLHFDPESKDDKNPVASKFLYDHTGNYVSIRGPVAIELNHKLKVKQRTIDVISEVRFIYEQMFNASADGAKRRKSVSHHRASHMFSSEFQSHLRKNLDPEHANMGKDALFKYANAKSREAWAAMTDEQKRPYYEREEKDKQRFEEEQSRLRERFPRPPINRRNSYNFFLKSHKADEWESFTEEQKRPFVEMANQDKERYEKDLKEFIQKCEKNGLDHEWLLLPKSAKRKRSVSVHEEKTESFSSARKSSRTKKVRAPKIDPIDPRALPPSRKRLQKQQQQKKRSPSTSEKEKPKRRKTVKPQQNGHEPVGRHEALGVSW